MVFGLHARLKDTQFSWIDSPSVTGFNFNGVIIDQLLQRRIQQRCPDAIYFGIGKNPIRFGRNEFALTTGLKFSALPSTEEFKKHLSSNRLLTTYFPDPEHVDDDDNKKPHRPPSVAELEAVFLKCTNKDDCYKLGLCLIVEGVIRGKDSWQGIWEELLSMVDELPYFMAFPWGHISWAATLEGLLATDPKHLRSLYENRGKKQKKVQDAKYVVQGFLHAVQFWAYEAIEFVGVEYGKKLSENSIPRMLKWVSMKQARQKGFTKKLIRQSVCFLTFFLRRFYVHFQVHFDVLQLLCMINFEVLFYRWRQHRLLSLPMVRRSLSSCSRDTHLLYQIIRVTILL